MVSARLEPLRIVGSRETDVAGRYYPDLDDMDTQNYFADRFRTAEENGKRVPPGETTESAIGLRSGTVQFTRAEKWRGASARVLSAGRSS